jgi:urease accessory protein
MIAFAVAAEAETTGWRADLFLAYAGEGTATILAENRHSGPLRVQRPFYPEGAGVCHTCILHPPGGLVGGDSLNLELAVGPAAHALVTTPGATKFYRSGGKPAGQHQRLTVHGGVLEWLPQEVIFFPGADASSSTEVRLDDGGVFLGWEIFCLGLPSRKELFEKGRLHSRFAIYRAGRPIFLDRLRVAGRGDLDSVVGLRGRPVTGSFIASGVGRELQDELRELLPQATGGLAGLTVLDDLLVARYLGESTGEARDIFQRLWSWLRPRLLGRPACLPRIWAT